MDKKILIMLTAVALLVASALASARYTSRPLTSQEALQPLSRMFYHHFALAAGDSAIQRFIMPLHAMTFTSSGACSLHIWTRQGVNDATMWFEAHEVMHFPDLEIDSVQVKAAESAFVRIWGWRR